MAVLKMPAGRQHRPAASPRLATWLLAALGLFFSCTQAAAAAPSAEYKLKAVFLFNFTQFVEWPAEAFPSPTAPLVIGVLGEDPFGSYLDDLVSGEMVGGRSLLVRRARQVDELAGCHIVFIGRSEARGLEKILGRLKDRPLLTVSDTDAFTRLGGMVRFALENGKIRLRINVEAAKASQLTISSKVLRPDTIATPGKD